MSFIESLYGDEMRPKCIRIIAVIGLIAFIHNY